MNESWKISLPCTRTEAEILAEDHLFITSSDSTPTIVTREIHPDHPDAWMIDVYCEHKPQPALLKTLLNLSPSAQRSGFQPEPEPLGDEDWVTMSQQGLEPLRAGRFHVHTSNDLPSTNPRLINLCIDAGRAFGTGHHETTTGCLRSLDQLQRAGRRFRNIADIGTGTGLLAFAAHHLWPDSRIIASDIDPIAVAVTADNARENGIATGHGRNRMRIVESNGLDHPAIGQRGPYDLIIANILAGPLIALAPQIAAASQAGTVIIVAGLLSSQKAAVTHAYLRAGFRLRHSRLENEWPCLTLVRARTYGRQRPLRRRKSPLASDYFGEC